MFNYNIYGDETFRTVLPLSIYTWMVAIDNFKSTFRTVLPLSIYTLVFPF